MHLLLSFIFSLIVAGIAILSVQNAGPVAVKLLIWQSVVMPEGVVLSFAFGCGVLLVALAQPLWQLTVPLPQATPTQREFDVDEFDLDEDWE